MSAHQGKFLATSLSFPKVCKRDEKAGEQQIVSSPINFFGWQSVEIISLKHYIENVEDGDNIFSRRTRQIMTDVGSYRIPVKRDTANMNAQCALSLKNVLEVFCRQVWFCKRKFPYVPAGAEKAILESCFSEYHHGLHSDMLRRSWKEVDGISRQRACSNREGWPKRGVVRVTFQVFSEILAITLKRTALVAYPVKVNHLDGSARKSKWLVLNERTMAGLLLVYCRYKLLKEEENGEHEKWRCTN